MLLSFAAALCVVAVLSRAHVTIAAALLTLASLANSRANEVLPVFPSLIAVAGDRNMPSPSAGTATLPPDEVHLYLVDDTVVAAPSQLTAYRALLTAEEEKRWDRLRFPKHRNQFLVARALVRGVLSHYRPGIRPSGWRFEVNAYGRPRLAPGMGKDMHFNLSHTEGRVVLAVATAPLLGVDIEWCARPGSTWEAADAFFSSEEASMLRAMPPARRLRRFLDVWTLKEAYIKARGMGLSLPLADFTIRFAGETGLSIAFAPGTEGNPAPWQLWQVCAGPDYALSLALSALGPWRLRLFYGAPLTQFTEVECRVLRSTAQLDLPFRKRVGSTLDCSPATQPSRASTSSRSVSEG